MPSVLTTVSKRTASWPHKCQWRALFSPQTALFILAASSCSHICWLFFPTSSVCSRHLFKPFVWGLKEGKRLMSSRRRTATCPFVISATAARRFALFQGQNELSCTCRGQTGSEFWPFSTPDWLLTLMWPRKKDFGHRLNEHLWVDDLLHVHLNTFCVCVCNYNLKLVSLETMLWEA